MLSQSMQNAVDVDVVVHAYVRNMDNMGLRVFLDAEIIIIKHSVS